MKVMLNFSDYVSEKMNENEEDILGSEGLDESLNESEEISLTESIGEDYYAEELLEKINVLAIAKKANNIEDFKSRITTTLEKDAPSLAMDDDFIQSLMKSYTHTDLS